MLLCNLYDIMKERLVSYLRKVVGFEILILQPKASVIGKLPLYLRDEYKWHEVILENRPCLFAMIDNENHAGINQIGKQFQKVKEITGMPVVAVFDSLEAYNRKRLIEKKIAFIVPDKQLYIPELIIDLREYSFTIKKKKDTLSPMAQQILLLFLLDSHNKLEIQELAFKKLAELLKTNPMGITRAVESLKNQELIEIIGDKERTLHFAAERDELWMMAKEQDILINPVLKKVFIDELPQNTQFLRCFDNALTEYTDMNPARQEYYAIEKKMYYALKKANKLFNENKYEGKYCIEVWKYDPTTIITLLFKNTKVVDPLSLFLCYLNTEDERIEMAMEQIEKEFIW